MRQLVPITLLLLLTDGNGTSPIRYANWIGSEDNPVRLKRKDLFQADYSSRFHLPVKSDSSYLINLSLSSGASPCEVRCGPRLSLLADEILSI